MVFLYVFTALIAVWGIASYFCMGEKFMRWYYGQWGHDYREFDARKFKIAHAVSIFLVGVSGFFVGGDVVRFFIVLTLVFSITNFILILQWCKKKDSSSK